VERRGKGIYLNWKVLVFSLAVVTLSCATRSVRPKGYGLNFKPISCELASIELSQIQMLFRLQVTNTTRSDLRIQSMSYEFYINNYLVSTGDFLDRPVTIRAKSSRNLEKFIPIPEAKQTEKVKEAIRERKGLYRLRLTYTLEGSGRTSVVDLKLPIKGLYQ